MLKLSTVRTATLSILVPAILLSPFIVLWLVEGNHSLTETIMNGRQYRNTSNITREQYRAALAKWNNLHVTDYEATIQHSGWGKWKIGVHVDNAYGSKYAPGVQASYSHRIVLFESLDSEVDSDADEIDVYDHYAYEFLTVGGLFDDIDDLLYCQENSCEGRHYFLPTRYVVEFDQTMGYPRSITSITEYATVETRIENVKVLK